MIKSRIQPLNLNFHRDSGQMENFKKTPLFKVNLCLIQSSVVMLPSLDELQTGLHKSILSILKMSENIEPWKHMKLSQLQLQKVNCLFFKLLFCDGF